jgi:hypothetical protein
MAFVYLTGGFVIRVPEGRDAILTELNKSSPGRMLEFQVEIPSGGARVAVPVSVAATQIVLVSDTPIPTRHPA